MDGIFMAHAFARITRRLAMLQELYRVARPGARLVIRVGGTDPASGTPAQRCGPDSFGVYGQPARAGLRDDYMADWLVKRVVLVVNPELVRSESDADLVARARVDAAVAREIIVELQAVKPTRPRDPRLLENPAPSVSRSPIDPDSAF